MISGVELPPNKATESAEEIEEKVHRINETNLDISREGFDYELDEVHRLPLIKSHQTQKIICKFRTHCFREYLSSKKKDILNITNKVMNKSMTKSGFSMCLYRFRFIVFLMVLLIKYIYISTFLTNSAKYTMAFLPPT